MPGLPRFRRLAGLAAAALLAGCASTGGRPPLEAIDRRVDLERFMGDWYVLASIPIDTWLASEADAYNGVESYALRDDGKIQTTYTFRKGGFDGPVERFEPVGWVHDHETNAEWRMQFVWPFRSPYLIVYLDEDYQQTIIGVPDRGNVWILARTPDVGEARYEALVGIVAELGHDTSRLRRVPQRWPDPGAPSAQPGG